MRIMGIDYGDSRIGISISDPMGWTAQGLETIKVKTGINPVLDRIKELIRQYKIERIVVGLPLNMNGTIGYRGKKTLEFIEKLKSAVEIDVVKWDERLTTVLANKTMRELGVKTPRKKAVIDQIAAVYILQGYLDSLR